MEIASISRSGLYFRINARINVESTPPLRAIHSFFELNNCNFSDTFIQKANDLQIMEAINECYDEYKLLEF